MKNPKLSSEVQALPMGDHFEPPVLGESYLYSEC